MTAELLREAAELMRERAKKAERGRWKLWGMTVMADPKGTGNVDDGIEVAQAYTPSTHPGTLRTFNARHIASWHPDVAIAVADWLDGCAGSWTLNDEAPSDAVEAVAVARAYLGLPTP